MSDDQGNNPAGAEFVPSLKPAEAAEQAASAIDSKSFVIVG
jgi:hypothetical protein